MRYTQQNIVFFTMKQTLTLFLLLSALAGAETETKWLPGVTDEGGWYDISKHNVSGSGPDDSQTCASVAAANMMAYWLDRHRTEEGQWMPKAAERWGKTAEEIYENIYRVIGNNPYLIWQVINSITDSDCSAKPVAAYFDTHLTNKVDMTPEGDYKGKLFTLMKAEDAFEWGIANGAPMGIAIMNMASGAAHALTVWGIEYEVHTYGGRSDKELKYLYYTNSDNGYKLQKGLVGAVPTPVGDSFATSYTLTYQEGDDTRTWHIASVDFLFDPFALPSAVDVKDDHPYELSAAVDGELTAGGKHADATSFDLAEDCRLCIGEGKLTDSRHLRSAHGATATLSGSGTYVAHDMQLGAARPGEDWHGTVRLTGYAKALTADGISGVSRPGSAVELSAVSAADIDGPSLNLNTDLRLTNAAIDDEEAALQLRAMSGEKNLCFSGALCGEGDMVLGNWDRDGNDARISCEFSGDLSRWTGRFLSRIKNGGHMALRFAGGTVRASVRHEGEGELAVTLNRNTVFCGALETVNKGVLSVSAEDGVQLRGRVAADTLRLCGKVTLSAPPAPRKMTVVFEAGAQLITDGAYAPAALTLRLSDDFRKAGGNEDICLISGVSNAEAWLKQFPDADVYTDGKGNILLRPTR